MKITKEQYKEYSKSTVCHICNKEVISEDKVCDHCYFTGEYRGPAHRNCNLHCRKRLIIPVIFHNLQGYDAHLFIKHLAVIKGDFTCIPSTEEKYISFSKKVKVDEYQNKDGKTVFLNFELRFIDSFKFLQTSLANLVSNLQPDDFINTKEIFRDKTELLTRKGVYPYDYVSSISKFDETQLPPKKEFYSKLNDEDITDDEYQHALNVWNEFNCKNIRDYHDLYLKSDVLLLADVFENFRKKLICHFKPRKNYVVHFVNLMQYHEMGMILTAVHKGISFNQSPWIEPYIRKNTELRKCASNSFEKDFFKLMNNSVFGKTIENIRKRQNIILISDRD